MWYLRLTHTKLADAILDICGVPAKENTRRACLRILTQFTSPPPSKLRTHLPIRRKRSNSRSLYKNPKERLSASLENAVENLDLPQASAASLKTFILSGCFPLPENLGDALEAIKSSLLRLRQSQKKVNDARRARRFDEAGKCIQHLVNLSNTLFSIGIGPLLGAGNTTHSISRPIYISLDLGLRQRRANYHGHTLFQCISLKKGYFESANGDSDDPETHDSVLASSGPGLKVAEGGRYDELVRRYRPPGNFGSSMLTQYTTASIPKCAGVRFSVGRLVQLVYEHAAETGAQIGESWQALDSTKFSLDNQGMELLRGSLGHPINFAPASVRCVVSGVHGLDAGSCNERFTVASRLWAEGMYVVMD